MRCDIIIPVWNQPKLTSACIESIFKNTSGEYRIIIIDNASGDETRAYLETLKNDRHVTVVRNSENVGYIKAVNQGMRLSAAPFVCFLNNDTLVTKDWLDIMIDIASRDARIGLVNPSSNNLGQRPENGETIDALAARLRVQSSEWLELGACIGFCMLVRREVIERIGYLDEVYGMGNFDDTDYSRRAVKEGFMCVRACGAYVFHRENASFNKIKTFDADFQRNKEIFEFRWGRPRRIAYIIDSQDNALRTRIDLEALRLARDGNWVWYLYKDDIAVPRHANIRFVKFPERYFYVYALWRIVKKKKRFNEIYTDNEKCVTVLKLLRFIHKADVNYY